MTDVWFDLREALRGIRRDSLYAAAVMGTLALTLGASTAVFSIVDGVLLRPLPYRDPGQLVSIREVVPQVADHYPTLPANGLHFEEWRRHATSFAAMAELNWRETALTGAGDPAQVTVLRASGTVFDVLQLPVAVGRPLTRDDEAPDRPRVAVISDQLWRDRVGGDAAAIGRTLTLGGTPYTIVGVLRPDAVLPTFDVLSESGTLTSKLAAVIPFAVSPDSDWMGTFNYPVIARLKAGVDLAPARAELDVLQHSVADIARVRTHETVDLRGWMIPLDESIVGRTRRGLLLLLGAIGGVVLIACANLANLSLTRALGRMREAAVRSALGASRSRLVRRVVVEQLVLAAGGGALGLFVAREALVLFVRTAPIDLPRVAEVAIDGRVLAFAASVAIAAGLGVALLPAWRMGRGDLQSTLRGGGHGTTDRGGIRVRSALLGVQVALSVMLLVVTGLFVTSFMRLAGVDPGFSPDHVVTVEIAPVARRYPDADARARLYDRILERVRGVPGMTSIAWTSALPLTGETWVDVISRLGDTQSFTRKPSANYRFVGPEYFRALSMPILKGRSFDEHDRAREATPAVVSARAAQTIWPNEDPIGRRFTRSDPDTRFEVVGVVVDGHPTALDAESPLMVYVPYWYNNEGKSVLVAHTSGDAAAVVNPIRREIRAVDPEIAIADISPLQQVVDKAVEGRRYQAWLFAAFGIVALLIATVGVYATTAYGVSRRRREMNIRVALGARASQVFGLIVRQTSAPLAIGIAAGCAGALAAGTLVAGLLFDVRPNDPAIIVAVVGLVGAIGVAAAALAAGQGMRIDPAAALRDE